MADHGERVVDAEFQRIKESVTSVYKQAYRDIEQKGKEFAEAHARREAMYRQQLADGKITQADFDAWMRGQVFQGKQCGPYGLWAGSIGNCNVCSF